MEKIEVELPNGEIIEFPGGTPDTEINQAIETYLATQGAASPMGVPTPEAVPDMGLPTAIDTPVVDPVQERNARNQQTNPFAFDFEMQREMFAQRQAEDAARAVNDRVMAAPEAPFRRDVLYPPVPPQLGFADSVLSTLSDVGDALIPGEQEPNRFQQRRNERNTDLDQYYREAQEIWEMYGTPMESGIGGLTGTRTAEMAVPDPESELGYRIETVRLPDPNGTNFFDILKQTGLTVAQETGDLVTEGAITTEGEFSKSIPDYQLGGGSQFVSDVLSFMMPGIYVDKVVRRGARALSAGSRATTAGRFVAGAATETIMTSEDDSPLVVNPEAITEVFKGLSPEAASDIAMLADALFVNGAFNTIATGVLMGGAALKNKVQGAVAGLSSSSRRTLGERGTIMEVIKFLDPEIDSFGEAHLKRNLGTFSTIIGSNANVEVVFGQVAEQIPVATVNALMRGAEDYIRISRVPAKRNMSPDEWASYVNQEATLMVNRMIGMTGAEAGAGQAVAQRQAEISDGVRSIMRRGAEAELPAGVADTREAMGQATDSLIDVRRTDIGSADTAIAQGTDDLANTTARLSNVASDNEIIRGLLDGSTPPTEFFREGPFVERMKTLMGDELYTAYRTAFDNSDRAYAAIPNTPISEEGITAFRSVLDDVVRDANQIDSSGGTARNILGRVYNAFQPQTAMDAAGDVVVETTEELMSRLSDLGFQDMYRLKQQLSRVVDSQPQGPVRDRLIELRRHITDGDTGQIAILRQTGDSATATAAEAADQTFREAMARFSNSAPMKQFSDLAGTQRAVGGTYDTVAGAARRGEPDMIAQGVGNILPQITNDTTGAYFDNFALALDTVMSRGELDEVMSSRVTSEALYNLGLALQNSDQQSADLIISSIRPHAAQLERANPGLLDTLERASGQVRQEAGLLTSQADEARAVLDQAQQAKTQAENSILRKFIDPESTNVEAISNPRGVLLNMMNGNNAGNEYKALIDQIARIPDAGERAFAEQALRATTIENISEKLFTSATGAMVEPGRASAGVSMSNIQRILESNGNNILDVVDTVFAGSDPIKQHYRTVLAGLATDELPKSVKFRLYGSDTASQLAIRDAASTGILLTLGYMNPTAAAARRLSAEFVERAENDLKNVRKETMVNMLAYPEEFARLTDVLLQSREPNVIMQAVGELTNALAAGVRAELRTSGGDTDQVIELFGQQ